jgi:predicted Zn-dependent protease
MKALPGWRLGLGVVLALGLIGCGMNPPMGQASLDKGHSMDGLSASSSLSQGNSAVVALLNSAHEQLLAGDYEQASAALERALRLEPRNAMLWHRLAQVRLGQGQWRNAIEFAAKSNSLAGGQQDLQASNWLVIAQAKQRQGDLEGAAAARAQSEGKASD